MRYVFDAAGRGYAPVSGMDAWVVSLCELGISHELYCGMIWLFERIFS